MGIIVQKYGGTSLRNIYRQNNIVNHVKACIDEGNHPIIVVSAMGRKGEPYATDTLISLLENINSEIDLKKKDLIMSCGEVISASIVSHYLDSEGFPAEAMTGLQAGILTDNSFTSAEILTIDASKIMKHVAENKIVVVAGFQGSTDENETTTLGRGGSDTTAVVLGGYLKAERVDIFTDVPGVAVIDPKIVPETKYIDEISYEKMLELSLNGVGVIHPRAVTAGKNFNIPIRILSPDSNEQGTLIYNSEDTPENKIICIALKSDDNIGVISVFFRDNNKDEVKKDFQKFLYEHEDNLLDIFWYDNRVSILVKSDKTSYYGKKIYSFFFD